MSKSDPITVRFDDPELAGIKTLAERTKLNTAEIVRRLCEYSFAKIKITGDISFLLEPTQTAVREEDATYAGQALSYGPGPPSAPDSPRLRRSRRMIAKALTETVAQLKEQH